MESEMVSWFALIVAVIAVGFSWYTALQSRRQADAVLGDLPPVISLFQPDSSRRAFAVVELEVINHNRRPLYIERIKFDFPDNLRIFRAHQEQRQALMAIMAAVVKGTRDFTFDLSHRLAGHIPGSPPSTISHTFNVSTSASTRPDEPFDVKIWVWYRIDGEDMAHEEARSMTWRPVAELD